MKSKPANPNTAYGRKRLRKEYQEWRNQASPKERSDDNTSRIIIWIFVVGIGIMFAFLTGGGNGVLKWLTH